MKKRISLLVLLLLCLALFAACSAPAPKGPNQASISLPGNATTGYAWMYAFSEEGILSEVSNQYDTDSAAENMAGAGGTFNWVFKAEKPGTAQIQFVYAPDLDTKQIDQPDTTATYTFTVEEGNILRFDGAEGSMPDIPDPKLLEG